MGSVGLLLPVLNDHRKCSPHALSAACFLAAVSWQRYIPKTPPRLPETWLSTASVIKTLDLLTPLPTKRAVDCDADLRRDLALASLAVAEGILTPKGGANKQWNNVS
jgi:hypothetical protein